MTATTGSYTHVSALHDYTCAVRTDGVIECWGYDEWGTTPATRTAGGPTTRVLPTANFTAAPASVFVGQAVLLHLSNARVPGHPEVTSFTYAFNCGDGNGYGGFSTRNTGTCSPSAAGTWTVKGTVKDPDGDTQEYTATVEVTTPLDNTPPVITPNVSGTLGTNGWYTSDVTVTWSVTDAESSISAQTGCGSTTINADTPGQTVTCSATSVGGTNSESVIIKRDASAPTIAPGVAPNPVILNGTATASPNATDALSGIASASCATPSTATVGSKTLDCSAMDQAGNSATKSVGYTVTFQFVGFSGPVDGGGVLNSSKAGQNIPLKWRLLDANGVPVTTLSAATATATTLACAVGTSVDQLEEYAVGSSGLQNLGDGYYQFNWATQKSYAGSCKTMQLDLREGITRNALFQFTK